MISYASSGSFEVTLHAIEGTDTNTTSQFITINVAQAPVADFITNSPAIWPNAELFFTNNSTNASSYFWDFGDGNTSTDSNPWNDYGQTGTFVVMLVAENDLCPNDTLYQTVEIIDVTAIKEKENNLVVYPNPFTNQIVVSGITPNENCVVTIYDQSGRTVCTKTITSTSNQLVLENLDALASGIYTLQIFYGESISKFPLVKN
ncbi:MAG: T9SS type A sorting domain-containing protein [Crocinitomicaceae bacterium]|nr:T9SS type A sorting domain-containing protein [Crocinitomicaceae bacterium]